MHALKKHDLLYGWLAGWPNVHFHGEMGAENMRFLPYKPPITDPLAIDSRRTRKEGSKFSPLPRYKASACERRKGRIRRGGEWEGGQQDEGLTERKDARKQESIRLSYSFASTRYVCAVSLHAGLLVGPQDEMFSYVSPSCPNFYFAGKSLVRKADAEEGSLLDKRELFNVDHRPLGGGVPDKSTEGFL